ncbi:hypothetical protein, partial [Paraburkholderia caribensis]|uniref:hypothetical protein n=1 Tax=Paraburkholderia caribensis TaxID=75105 RepID=UPI00286C90B7
MIASATFLLCFMLHASLFGGWSFALASFMRRRRSVYWAFALASALRYLASSVAPVRGGTYFSLPPQRKVGKRKRLTP